MANSYAQQSDLEIALGGKAVLLQLADPNNQGAPDPATVTDYLESGAVLVRSAVEVKHDPETIANLDAASLRLLLDANAALSARIAWEKGGKGMACPTHTAERADRYDAIVDKIAEGKRRLGRVAGGTSAAINQQAEIVDYDSSNPKISINAQANQKASGISIDGFRRGFR